jgi:SAM-dependent methyltransferase
MPSIEENRQVWDTTYDWPKEGDEWSAHWGSPSAQWDGCIFPRIFPFLNGRILEIAPGYGRWTQFLQIQCASLIGIDLAQSCVEHCQKRFGDCRNLEFKVNDGRTLQMLDDASIDFAFSFDSLVHADADAMSSYVSELARVLKPGGVAFIHHSNLGSFWFWRNIKRRLFHWRAPSMSADKMREFAERSGMSCLQQEIIPWGKGSRMIDCLTTIVNRPGIACVVVKNHRFMEEAWAAKRICSCRWLDPN